jgi:hypothetical protein
MSKSIKEKKTKKRRRTKQKRNYFNEDTELAVVEYLKSDSLQKKNRVFKEKLAYPMYKLVEGIINKYQLYSKEFCFEDLHKDVLSYLISKMDKFNPDLGYKAYSYYGTIVVRRLRYIQKEESERQRKHLQYDDSFQEDERFAYQIEEDDQDSIMVEAFQSIVTQIDYLLKLNEKEEILKEEERRVGVAILEVMNNWENILSEDERGSNKKYEKNKILMCLRDITGYTTKDIRKYSKKFKRLYYDCKGKILEDY